MAETIDMQPRKLLRIGWVGTGPFSFYGDYMRVINNHPEPNPLLMRVTHIWGDDYARNYRGSAEFVDKQLKFWRGNNSPKALAERYHIPNVCNDFHDMVDEIDAAMIMDFDRSPELAEPFIRKGMPIFLCSPVAVDVPTCERILDLAEQYGSAVYTGSFTVGMAENKVMYDRAKKNDIATFYAHTYCGFFSSYANDGLEPIHELVGGGVRKVQMIGWNGSGGYDPHGIPVSRIHLEYEPRGDRPPIQGFLNLGGQETSMEWYRIHYHDHTCWESDTHWTKYVNNFRDFLLDIQQVFMTNKSIETREDILQKLRVVIAAYKSANEDNRPVRPDEVGDYRMPTIRIEKWNELP